MNTSTPSAIARITPWAAALSAIAWLAAIVLDVFSQTDQLNSAAYHADNILLLIVVVTTAVALTGMQRWQAARVGWLGRVGLWLTIAALVALAASAVAGLAGNEAAIGPAYPIGAAVSRVGLILWGIAAYRAAILPRWLGPALALAWLVAPPLGPSAGAFALPVAWTVIAFTLWRTTRHGAPSPAL